MYTIYLISNCCNDKKYVGVTSRAVEVRFGEHRYASDDTISQAPLHIAMRDIGVDKFSWEILESNISEDLARERETYYIDKLNTLEPFRYNTYRAGMAGIAILLQPSTIYLRDYKALYILRVETLGFQQRTVKSSRLRLGVMLSRSQDVETILNLLIRFMVNISPKNLCRRCYKLESYRDNQMLYILVMTAHLIRYFMVYPKRVDG